MSQIVPTNPEYNWCTAFPQMLATIVPDLYSTYNNEITVLLPQIAKATNTLIPKLTAVLKKHNISEESINNNLVSMLAQVYYYTANPSANPYNRNLSESFTNVIPQLQNVMANPNSTPEVNNTINQLIPKLQTVIDSETNAVLSSGLAPNSNSEVPPSSEFKYQSEITNFNFVPNPRPSPSPAPVSNKSKLFDTIKNSALIIGAVLGLIVLIIGIYQKYAKKPIVESVDSFE